MSEQSGRNEKGNPGSDLLADLQRWLIRSSAKNVRRELEGQVRRTLGGQRQDRGDVWDVATTEIPPEVGEAPECQWCPICRAARRMRDSGPGLSGQLSGAGEAVSTAVQDAISMLDSLLGRTGRSGAGTGGGRDGTPASGGPAGGPGRASGSADARRGEGSANEPDPASAKQDAGAADGPASRPDSLAGEHGPSGGKPGDRLGTAGIGVTDPWASATEVGDTADGTPTATEDEGQDGRGHAPSDRG